VLFAVPGAFTPGCSVKHLPGYIENMEKIKNKSVDVVAVLAFNDAWVMSAWAKANGIKDEIVCLSPDNRYATTDPSSSSLATLKQSSPRASAGTWASAQPDTPLC